LAHQNHREKSLEKNPPGGKPWGRPWEEPGEDPGEEPGEEGPSIPLPKPYFTISASPSSKTISPGASTTYTIIVTSHNESNDLVSLSIGRLPKGCRGSFPSPYGVTPPKGKGEAGSGDMINRMVNGR